MGRRGRGSRSRLRTVNRPVALPWAQQVAERLGFEPALVTLADTAAQVVAHTAHHRGQVMTRLRGLGGNPPLIDFIAWVWRGEARGELALNGMPYRPQGSTVSPGTRTNSRTFAVAMARLCVRQAAASQRSFGPIT